MSELELSDATAQILVWVIGGIVLTFAMSIFAGWMADILVMAWRYITGGGDDLNDL
jgi:hypothetical protein